MYDELIEALRCCSRVDTHNTGCDDCPYEYCGSQCDGLCKTAGQCITDLTAHLAALQAENKELKKRLEVKETILRLYETTLSLVSGDKDTAIYRMRKAEAALARVEAERDAAKKEIERLKDIMRENGIMAIPGTHPGGRSEWNIRRGAQGEG